MIASAERFLFQAKVFGSGEPIKAGEYEFPARASHAQILVPAAECAGRCSGW